jgi:hypothetical protein
VRLEPGSHRSPEDGVCVVELASMIGGERFSDRPDCVCPVIAAFLRSWNDRVGYADRQRIEPYASLVVGTGGYRRMSRIRRDLCLSWTGADLDHGPIRRAATRLHVRAQIAWRVGIFPAVWLKEGAGAYAAQVCFARGGIDEAFALLDRLLDVGSPSAVEGGSKLPPRWAAASLKQLESPNGNGHGNGNAEADHAVRGRASPAGARSRDARGSGSGHAAAGDRPDDPRAEPPLARS